MQLPGFDLCQFFGLAILRYCALEPDRQSSELYLNETQTTATPTGTFTPEYEWSVVNFTWPTRKSYQDALSTGAYIPENNAIVGLKFYKNRMYLALPRLRSGTPVTLASISTTAQRNLEVPIRNILLEPFPSWDQNVQTNCNTLQNVQSMEIDRRGILWVLDGTRMNNFTRCPPKLVLYDLNKRNRVVTRYNFPSEICLTEGGFLNDLVIDDIDGGYAYITDNSVIDPGLIVYSRKERRSWKLRDRSMFPELDATDFTVDGVRFQALAPIDGIALSPVNARPDNERTVFYNSLAGFNIYAISNRILRNEAISKGDQWRFNVTFVGRKSAVGDGMIIDNKGNMFFGLIQSYGIGTWNIYDDFETANEVVSDSKVIIWPDSFAIDDKGFLYSLCNGIHKLMDPNNKVFNDGSIKVRILRQFTGNKSYLFEP